MLRTQKIRLASLIAIFVGVIGLGILPSLNVLAGPAACIGTTCTFVDTTVNDFVQGQFYATGLGNRGDGEVQLLPLGLTSEWITETYRLPGARKELAAVIYNDTIYVIGGTDDAGGFHSEIFTATTAYTGGIKAPGWFTATTMPKDLTGMPAVISTTATGAYLYVLGGYIGSNASTTSTIFYRALNTNGGFASGWQTAAMPQNLVYHQAVVHGGYLYVLGGNSDSGYINDVNRAPINANGSLGAWVSDTILLTTLGSFGVTTWSDGLGNDYLYVMGGSTDGTSGNSQATVYYSQFNPDGSLGAWNTTGSLLNAYQFHTALQNNGQILVIGGQKAGSPVSQVASAFIDTNGALRSFPTIPAITWFESSVLPQSRYSHVSVVNSGGDVYLIAGIGTDDPQGSRNVYRGASFGFGARYAPFGNFVSRIFNLTGQTTLNNLQWNTLISQTGIATITLQYRATNSLNTIFTTTWQTVGNAAAGVNITNNFNFPANTFGSYFQYRALFTATTNVTGTGSSTGVLNQLQLTYVKPAPPDLKIFKTDNVNRVRVGDYLTYTIRYTNSYPGTINNVVLTETLPLTASFISAGSTPGWTPIGGKYVLNVGPMNANEVKTATIILSLDGVVTQTIQNRVDIDYDRAFNADTNPGDNTWTDVDIVDRIDLAVTTLHTTLEPTHSPDTSGKLQVGPTTYIINYFNYGTITATNVVLTESAHSGLIGNLANDPRWKLVTANVFTYSVGILTPGVSGQITFTAYVDPNLGTSSYVSNTVAIATSDKEDDLSNNKVDDWDQIDPPDLEITQDDGAAIASQNKTLVYTITVRNIGGSIAHNVVITETPSVSVTVSGPPAGWSAAGSNYIRPIGNVTPGLVFTYPFPVVVNSNVANGQFITNTVRVEGSDESINPDPVWHDNNLFYDVDFITTFAAELKITGVFTPGKIFSKAPTNIAVIITNTGNFTTPNGFYTDVYIDRIPFNRMIEGDNAPTYGGGNLPPGKSTTIIVGGVTFLTPGTHTLYAQVDTWVSPCITCPNASYGLVREFNELNNVFGPITVIVDTAVSTVYLPVIFR